MEACPDCKPQFWQTLPHTSVLTSPQTSGERALTQTPLSQFGGQRDWILAPSYMESWFGKLRVPLSAFRMGKGRTHLKRQWPESLGPSKQTSCHIATNMIRSQTINGSWQQPQYHLRRSPVRDKGSGDEGTLVAKVSGDPHRPLAVKSKSWRWLPVPARAHEDPSWLPGCL